MGGVGGRLRSDDIHRKFWLYWKTLFMRVMNAQDTGSNQKTRALGTIESFLLMTEWHARALHFPPDVDGWDCEMLDASDDEEHGGNQKGMIATISYSSRVSNVRCRIILTHYRGEAPNRGNRGCRS